MAAERVWEPKYGSQNIQVLTPGTCEFTLHGKYEQVKDLKMGWEAG